MGADNEVLDQTQQVAAETPEQVPVQDEGQVEQANPGQHPGFQKRINELTAEKHEARRQAEALQAQLQAREEMMARMMAQVLERGSPNQPDPAADLAPEDRKKIDALVNPKVAALEKSLYQMQMRLEQQQFATQLAQEPPAVADLAQKLLGQWRSQGLQGWAMEDAIMFARGRLLGQDTAAADRARNERGQYIAGNQQVTRTQSAPPPPAPRSDQGLPADFDRRSPQEQADILEKRLEGKYF